jgi:vanillate monooxygenase ferredoxin subunit
VTFLTVNVASRSDEAEGICSFELVSADGDPLPAFTAGAHIDVHIPGGHVRQYSLCNNPSESGLYRIGILREDSGRGGSRAMHEVRAGDQPRIGLLPSQFELLGANKARSLLLAGGIGITPIFSMAQSLPPMVIPSSSITARVP